MKFYLRNFISRLWFLGLLGVWMLVIYTTITPKTEMEPILLVKQYTRFFEVYLMIPAYVLSLLTLWNRAENEFCQCYGVGRMRLSVAQSLPYTVLTIPAFLFMVLWPPSDKIVLDADFRLLALLSNTVRLFACTSLARLVRKATRDLYGSVGLGIVLFYLLTMLWGGSYRTCYQILFPFYTKAAGALDLRINCGFYLLMGTVFSLAEWVLISAEERSGKWVARLRKKD